MLTIYVTVCYTLMLFLFLINILCGFENVNDFIFSLVSTLLAPVSLPVLTLWVVFGD